jgi:hypothetical protein
MVTLSTDYDPDSIFVQLSELNQVSIGLSLWRQIGVIYS